MDLWRSIMFPRLMDACMAPTFDRYRPTVLAHAVGHVLEVGFGTGRNLPYYPPCVTRITAFDINPAMIPLARKKSATSPIKIDQLIIDSEHIAFADNTFDTVVSTWTLCSIPNVRQALDEIYRVLKPKGCFIFIEHGLSWEPRIQVWQRRLTPVQKKLADGCHLDRNIQTLLAQGPFAIERIDQFYAEQTPKIFGYLYEGLARKP